MLPVGTVILGDCIEVMAEWPADSVDAVVCDPPYGLEFMGMAWDQFDGRPNGTPRPRNEWGDFGSREHARTPDEAPRIRRNKALALQVFSERWAREALRVAKPGAYLLAFGGTRTVHRLACAIEDAGWEIRDCLVWAYNSGFPKSLDVSKAIDKAAGAEREQTGRPKAGHERFAGRTDANNQQWDRPALRDPEWQRKYHEETAPATPEAAKWQGWGTALKPAWEPIILARKPLRGTVAANVQRYGTGALNIDGCRIGVDERSYRARGMKNLVDQHAASDRPYVAGLPNRDEPEVTVSGRWPANVILTDPIFDGDVPGVVGGGETTSGVGIVGHGNGPSEVHGWGGLIKSSFGDSGTYSRFFLIPKASRSDREPVLGGLEDDGRDVPLVGLGNKYCDLCGESWVAANGWPKCGHGKGHTKRRPALNPKARANKHPTVKPVDLMRHLVRLVTPPGGLILDPFLGSGTTALAAEMEGFRWLGIEREATYVEIAEARLNGTQRGLAL